MQIVWDEPKRITNLANHDLDFADLSSEWFRVALVRPAKKGRLQAIGLLDGRPTSVIFVSLGRDALSVISMRPAGKSERKLL